MTIVLHNGGYFLQYLGLFTRKRFLQKKNFNSYEQQNHMSEITLLSTLTLARNHIIADGYLAKSSTFYG